MIRCWWKFLTTVKGNVEEEKAEAELTSDPAPWRLMLSLEQGKQNLWCEMEGHWTKWVSSSRSWQIVHFNVAVWNPPALPLPLVDDVVDAVLPLPPSDGCTWPMAELTPAPPPVEVAEDVLTPSGGVAAFNSAELALPWRPLFMLTPFPDDRRLVAEPAPVKSSY